MSEETKQCGGHREGSGRRKLGKVRMHIQVRPDVKEWIDKMKSHDKLHSEGEVLEKYLPMGNIGDQG